MRRGIANNHVLDMKLDFRFVNRGGEYVYEVWNHNRSQMLGTAKVELEGSKVVSFRADFDATKMIGRPVPDATPEANQPEQLELNLRGGG